MGLLLNTLFASDTLVEGESGRRDLRSAEGLRLSKLAGVLESLPLREERPGADEGRLYMLLASLCFNPSGVELLIDPLLTSDSPLDERVEWARL